MANETQITIPKPHAVFEAVMEDGAIIRVRRHGVPGAPRLVLSHGNGLAIDGYFSFWGRLLDRYDVIVYDFRNHGRKAPHHPPRPPKKKIPPENRPQRPADPGGGGQKADGRRVPFAFGGDRGDAYAGDE